ncbi:MAG: bifunctional diaminohydroxyphosphoribosylaminopyrimidine deaminase/5-amino-6-(5-phosphoribosylamino)uracil reductase RibD [Elusimicrobiota bacterium]
MNEDADLRHMRQALRLASRGGRRVSPNPEVGCVLVKGGRVVGRGWHSRFGGPHAEPTALRQAGRAARGATAYVNLEPCCAHPGKKTPPCTEALIRAGVRRVVAAMRDPNPLVSGRGLRRLRRAGIAVRCGVLEAEARRLNRPFETLVRLKRPHVILKAGISLDGRIETSKKQSKWVTSPEARKLSRRMRAESDAVLVGIGTVLADDPGLLADKGPHPLRAILDSRLRTPRRSKVVTGPGRALIFTSSRKSLPGAETVRVPRVKNGLDLRRVLRELARRGVASVFVEGGSAVHSSFLDNGLVDELKLFIAPRLLGGTRARSFYEGRGVRDLADSRLLEEVSVGRAGPDLLVSGAVRR